MTKIHDDIQNIFEPWKKRKLTIFGKTCIIISLAISKLVYKATILTYPGDEFMKKLLKLIFCFLWKSRERIKRNILIGNLKDGGIGLVDLFSKFKSLKAAWISRIIKNTGHLKHFLQSICGNIDSMYLLKTNVRKAEHFGLKELTLLYKEVLSAFNESNTCVKNRYCFATANMKQCIFSIKWKATLFL